MNYIIVNSSNIHNYVYKLDIDKQLHGFCNENTIWPWFTNPNGSDNDKRPFKFKLKHARKIMKLILQYSCDYRDKYEICNL